MDFYSGLSSARTLVPDKGGGYLELFETGFKWVCHHRRPSAWICLRLGGAEDRTQPVRNDGPLLWDEAFILLDAPASTHWGIPRGQKYNAQKIQCLFGIFLDFPTTEPRL